MLRIRLAERGDARAMADIYGAVVVRSAITFELVPPTEAEMAGRLEGGMAYAPWLVVEDDGRAVGFAYGSKHRERAAYQWSADASVYVDEGHRRRGIARALYTALFALLREQGFHAVHGGI